MQSTGTTNTADPTAGAANVLYAAAQVLAGLVGVAGLVYVCGGIALALRLQVAGLSSPAVVSQVPREFLVSVGLQVALPPAAVGAAYFLGRIARAGNEPPPNTYEKHIIRKWYWLEATPRRLVVWTFVLAAPLIYVVLVLPTGYSGDEVNSSELVVGGLLAGAILLIVLTQTVAISLRARIAHVSRASATRERSATDRYNHPVTVGLIALVIAGACLPTVLFVIAGTPPLRARVCPKDAAATRGSAPSDRAKPDRDLTGAFVAETGKRVYLIAGTTEQRFVSIPNGEVGAVLISREAVAGSQQCPNVPP